MTTELLEEKKEKGKWGPIREAYRNCGNCPRCKSDPKGKFHGPYYQQARRNPLTNRVEHRYISKWRVFRLEDGTFTAMDSI